jgi:F-type H+-transporting ATPase subunit epsilon
VSVLSGNTFNVEVLTHEKLAFSSEADYLKLPGWAGEMGILKNHAPLISLLKPGEMIAYRNGEATHLTLGNGVVRVLKDQVLILASYARRSEEASSEDVARIVKREADYIRGQEEITIRYPTESRMGHGIGITHPGRRKRKRVT